MRNLQLLASLFAVITLMAVVESCDSEPAYPAELSEADSLIMRGNTEEASALLSYFDLHITNGKNSVRLYRQLLELEQKFVEGNITHTDFALADTLVRFYKQHDRRTDKYGKALLFLGDTYEASGDFPSALKYYLEAESVSQTCANLILRGWCLTQTGDLYFKQHAFEESISYYRKYYEVSVLSNDSLRMSYAALRMGRVSTLNNDIDSTIYYYKKSITLGRMMPYSTDVVLTAQTLLSDIYIQTEEYDSASAIMTHDERFDENWAFWHYGQHHLDSATYYFQKMLRKDNLYAKVRSLHILANIAERQADYSKAIEYYERMISVQDTLSEFSQQEETKRTHAQYNYNCLKKERDNMEKEKRHILTYSLGFSVFLLILAVLYYYYEKESKKSMMLQQRMLIQEEKEKNKRSIIQLEDNKKKISSLEEELAKALQHDDRRVAEGLRLESEVLTAENHFIEAVKKRENYLTEEFKNSKLYLRLTLHGGDPKYKLSAEDWEQLSNDIDMVYQGFTRRLLNLVRMSDIEMKVCYLTKIGVQPSAMATILNKGKSSISMLRKRLYTKLTGKGGNAKDFDNFIKNF